MILVGLLCTSFFVLLFKIHVVLDRLNVDVKF